MSRGTLAGFAAGRMRHVDMNSDVKVPNQPPAVDPGAVRLAIQAHIEPMEVLGDVWHQEGKMWRAFVALRPSGPMVLMEFSVTI